MTPRHLITSMLTLVLMFAVSMGILSRCTESEFAGSGPSEENERNVTQRGQDDGDDGTDLDPDNDGDAQGDRDRDDDDDPTNRVVDEFDDLDDQFYGDFNDSDDPDDDIRILDGDFIGAAVTKPVEPEQRSSIWVVTTRGNAYWLKLDDNDDVEESKKWTGLRSETGYRTYVTEGGVVITGTGGHMYFIDPESTPEGDIGGGSNYHKLSGSGGGDRLCVVSYRKDKRRFLGVGWGNGKFTEIRMDNDPPYKPRWGDVTETGSVSRKWGYSCYIDQKRLRYYSSFVDNRPAALDLEDMEEVPASGANNGGFQSDNLRDETVGPSGTGSYAISGDSQGNVLNGKGVYTMSYEPRSRTVWVSGKGGGTLGIYPHECFYKERNCTGYSTFNMSQFNANIKPMSALGNGRMIGIQRGGNGHVYIMSLKDRKDIDDGIDVKRIFEAEGDPYMYTDFTGATLYLTRTEMTFDLGDQKGFKRQRNNVGLGFAWMNVKGETRNWDDIELKVRCYNDRDDKPRWDRISGQIKDAPKQTLIESKSCSNKKYDKVDLLLKQDNDEETLQGVAKVQITVYQSED